MYGHGYVHGRFICSILAFADAIVYSSLYLSLASFAMMSVAGMLQGVPFSLVPGVIGFCITFSIYNINRKSDETEDCINHAGRYLFTKRYERHLLFLSAVAYAAALLLAWACNAAAFAITVFPLATGILYCFPLLPRCTGFRRLKDIPLAKNASISAAWAVPHALLPAVLAGSMGTGMAGVCFLFFFVLVFINTVLFDMRDVEGDAAAGVRTVPVILGIPKTMQVLLATGCAGGILLPLMSLSQVPPWEAGVVLFGMAYGVGYLLWFSHGGATHAICDLVADGQFIVIGAVLYLASCIAG